MLEWSRKKSSNAHHLGHVRVVPTLTSTLQDSQHDAMSNQNTRAATRAHTATAPLADASNLRSSGLLLTAGSIAFIVVGLFCLLGGVEWLLDVKSGARSESDQAVFLIWPVSLAYFWPLIIPLGTYLVIARWTGDKHFRHA